MDYYGERSEDNNSENDFYSKNLKSSLWKAKKTLNNVEKSIAILGQRIDLLANEEQKSIKTLEKIKFKAKNLIQLKKNNYKVHLLV